MALIKHASATTLTRDAVVLDLGDLQRQGEQIVESARRRAEAVVREAQAERDRLIAGADDRGYQEGLTRGLAEGEVKGLEQGRASALENSRPQFEALQKSWSEALEKFLAARDQMLHEAEQDVLQLAVAIAEKVTKRAVELDPSVVVEQIRAVLAMIVRPTGLVVAVHPEDRALAEQAMPELLRRFPAVNHAQITGDPSLDRGSCVARTAGGADAADAASSPAVAGEIDASIRTQLDRIVETLLPAGSGGEPAGDGPKP